MLPSTLMIVQKSRITPTPAMSPPCVFASIELANPKTSRRTSSCPGKRSRIFSWRTFSKAKPLAIPKAMAMIGTMESSVKNVSAEARSWQRCSWKALAAARRIRRYRMPKAFSGGRPFARILQMSSWINFFSLAIIPVSFPSKDNGRA